MKHIYLVRHDADKNMHRFYQMFVVPGLLDDWSLIREWGRVGLPGTVRKGWFDSEEDAVITGEKIRVIKEKKGYQSILCFGFDVQCKGKPDWRT